MTVKESKREFKLSKPKLKPSDYTKEEIIQFYLAPPPLTPEQALEKLKNLSIETVQQIEEAKLRREELEGQQLATINEEEKMKHEQVILDNFKDSLEAENRILNEQQKEVLKKEGWIKALNESGKLGIDLYNPIKVTVDTSKFPKKEGNPIEC